MSKYLVIVESPTKAKTISSILGEDYEVISSMGHIIDLPTNKMAIDVENDFNPVYHVIPGKEKIINQIKKKTKEKEMVYLATDSDREGEAISWHIKNELAKKKLKFLRVVFHEITEEALNSAFKKPSDLDMDKVNAQIARRVLDRVVGYNLSPLLWKKIVRGLSAGRVQSIALKYIVEREKDILRFKPEITFSIEAIFKIDNTVFRAKLNKYKGKKAIFHSQEEALKQLEDIKQQDYYVTKVTSRRMIRRPLPPYITSLLQQDAFNKLRFSAQKTMINAQKLYEGIQINDKMTGLITYMRTDSFHVSPKAKNEAKEFIQGVFGKEYLSSQEHHYRKKKGAQLAHEAIRPSNVYCRPEEIAGFLSEDELKLYDLIWRRFIAVFMSEAIFENKNVAISSQEAEFEVSGRKIVFDGYLKVFDSDPQTTELPHLENGQKIILDNLEVIEHSTKAPARYNDASLVKLLEDKGIGRPSTYVPTIYTLIKRHYIKRERRSFIPTELGTKVSDLLVKYFPKIVDEKFTASMEEQLDEVEKGKIKWNKILEDFYPSFKKQIDEILDSLQKDIEYSDKICPKCQARMVIKWSRRGKFLSCERFPHCRYAESISTGYLCPTCKEGYLIERVSRRGQHFYGCSKFPKCTYTIRRLPDSAEFEDDS